MNRPWRTCLLGLAAAALAAAEPAADAVAASDARLAPPARFAGREAAFTVADETVVFKNDGSRQVFAVIRDHGRVVGVVHPGLNQLDMATFRPDRTPEQPPFADYYGWGTLLGTRITTAAWYGGMSASGTVTAAWSAGGSTLTLTTVQTWKDGPTGSSRYVMTLSLDPLHGYVWTIATDLAVAHPNRLKDGRLEDPEMLNWQVKSRPMGVFEGRRMPLGWECDRTVFLDAQDRLVGFFLNPPAVDRSRYKKVAVREGGFVASLPDRDGWGIALVHAKKAPFGVRNNTCNMWSDSHNLLRLPEQPDADGLHRVAAQWRFLALPPEEVQDIIARSEMDELGRAAFPPAPPAAN